MDFHSLGLKCGLEIHQQIDTRKLFCSCPSILRDESPDFKVKRILRAVPGEHGEIDVAALHEQLKGKSFLYEAYKNTNCLVEFDEEPPHPIDKEALNVALEVSLLLKAQIPDVIQVMRKTVIDGSNTSGFQRTALIALDGKVMTKEGTVDIPSICLEEDSARHISDSDGEAVYRLDRLGIPLIEIGTSPDIKTPWQCMQVAEYLGMILRSTGMVKRGIGTIRQDVNVSIKGGSRVEIKGAQDLRLLPLIVENEARRQLSLLEINGELSKRRPSLKKEIHDLTLIFANTSSKIIASSKKVLGIKLAGFAGLLGKEVQPGRRFGTELSDVAKVVAGIGGLFHSDELPKYGISEYEVTQVKERLGCKKYDGFVIIASDRVHALDAVFDRASKAMHGVPTEVRKALPDGNSVFMRPIPGAARMYPETDVPLIVPDVKGIKPHETIEHKVSRFQKLGITEDLAMQIAKSEHCQLFESAVKKYSVKPAFIAEVLTAKLTELRRDFNLPAVSDESIHTLFSLLEKNKIGKEMTNDVLISLANGTFDAYEMLTDKQLKSELEKIVKVNEGAPFSALMGVAIKVLKGRASGQKISEMLKKIIG